jgi:hypothetical protein
VLVVDVLEFSIYMLLLLPYDFDQIFLVEIYFTGRVCLSFCFL